MALRSLDNALPALQERPKKIAKIATAPAAHPPPTDAAAGVNKENALTPPPPTKAAEVAVDYVASTDLKDLGDPEAKIEILLEELDSRDWTKSCEALNDVRRFALYHSSFLLPILDKVMLLMIKSMKNPRSALCKTSIMASTDIFNSFGSVLLSSTSEDTVFDQLLLQLLLKASQDKKFVCEEAEKALKEMAGSVLPIPLLGKLQSYVKHANHRVRAKAAVSISSCVSKMGSEVMREFGLVTLLQIAGELLNDRLPEARESARSMVLAVYQVFSGGDHLKDDPERSPLDAWQDFCSSNLPPISAQSIAKITSQQ